MNPEVNKLPHAITSCMEKIIYEPEKEDGFEPEQPISYVQVVNRAIIKPLRLGNHAIRNRQGKSVSIETGKGQKLKKRPLKEETPIAVLTDMNDQDVHGNDTVRLSAPFAAWKGGIPVNATLHNPEISPALARSVRSKRRSSKKITS